MARHYDKVITTALKKKLLCRRANGYRFTEADVVELSAETKLLRSDILQWARDKRSYYTSEEELTDYLENNEPVS